MQAFKILVEECDTDFRKYHTNWELTQGLGTELKRHVVASTSDGRTDHRYDLAHKVVKLNGVTKVILSSYCLSVYIGKAFDWELIERNVLHDLKCGIVKGHIDVIALLWPKFGEKAARELIQQAVEENTYRFPGLPHTLDDLIKAIGLSLDVSTLDSK